MIYAIMPALIIFIMSDLSILERLKSEGAVKYTIIFAILMYSNNYNSSISKRLCFI